MRCSALLHVADIRQALQHHCHRYVNEKSERLLTGMQFNSYIFIMAFLPLFIVIYYALNKIKPGFSKIVLIIGSAVFYIYGGWKVTAVLGISILINYGTAIMISRFTPPPEKNIAMLK